MATIHGLSGLAGASGSAAIDLIPAATDTAADARRPYKPGGDA